MFWATRRGLFQRDRRLDLWTSVTRVQYSLQWGKLRFTLQYRLMFLRLEDQERKVRLRSELRSIPIPRVEYALLPRTLLRVGVQGFGPLPYRRKTTPRNAGVSCNARPSSPLPTPLPIFGYELVTIVGFTRDQQKFDSGFRDHRNFETVEFFVRALVGFTEFGRPI